MHLKRILERLIDTNDSFVLPTVFEQVCALQESQKWLRKLMFLNSRLTFSLSVSQLVILRQILVSYPAQEEELPSIRLLINPLDKYYQDIKTHLGYANAPVYQSAANRLAHNNSNEKGYAVL